MEFKEQMIFSLPIIYTEKSRLIEKEVKYKVHPFCKSADESSRLMVPTIVINCSNIKSNQICINDDFNEI